MGRANKADPQNYGAPLAHILRCHEQFVNGFAEWSPCFAVPVWSWGDSESLGVRVCCLVVILQSGIGLCPGGKRQHFEEAGSIIWLQLQALLPQSSPFSTLTLMIGAGIRQFSSSSPRSALDRCDNKALTHFAGQSD